MEVEDHLYYSVDQTSDSEQITLQRQKFDLRKKAENLRLLYVGLTRATNELYIMGATNRSKIQENCWYKIIHESFIEKATMLNRNYRLGEMDYKYAHQNICVSKENLKPKESKPRVNHYISNIAPSKMNNFEEISPYDSRYLSFEIGNDIHNLMSIYPKMIDKSALLSKIITNLYPKAKLRIDMQLLDRFFQQHQGSKIVCEASFIETEEIALSPCKILFRGSIDMLVFKDQLVTIYEFKSNINQPKTNEDLPQIYQNQMQKYCNIIARQFPQHKIEAKFFWIHTGTLTEFSTNSCI